MSDLTLNGMLRLLQEMCMSSMIQDVREKCCIALEYSHGIPIFSGWGNQ